MKTKISLILLLMISALLGWYSYFHFTGKYEIVGMFVSGVSFGMFLMTLRLIVKNDKINIYKRELEKESISSVESASRVKVLESKIEVLEKALENALKK